MLDYMAKIRLLLFMLTLTIVGGVALFVSYYARGYIFDFQNFKFIPNGLLIVKADPESVKIYINGNYKSTGNSNLSIPPGTYDISVKKEGFLTWNKRLTIEKEIVTEVNPLLFKSVPSLSAVTFSSAINPVPSRDMSKIAYIVPQDPSSGTQQNPDTASGLWIIENVNLPLGFSRDPKRITDGNLNDAVVEWSPDGREILLTTKNGVFLLNTSAFTSQSQRTNITSTLDEITKRWAKDQQTRDKSQTRRLPDEMADIILRKSKEFAFSPDEDMVLYTASASASIPQGLIKPLPGASTQKEERDLKPGSTYVYDLKEDRNFLINEDSKSLTILGGVQASATKRISWFPTSRQLILAQPNEIIIMDYDGTNKQTVYSGIYTAPNAYPSVSTDRLLILTNLGANSNPSNLYSLGLK